MSRFEEILSFNEKFVEDQKYEKYRTTKFPDKKMVIVTCMDARLTVLLPKAMNISNGDAKIIKSAGAIVTHPFGSLMRSIIVAIYSLNASEVFVVGHHDCGMTGLSAEPIIEKAKQNGVTDEALHMMKYAGVDVYEWLTGFNNVSEGVVHSVHMIKRHPFLPKHVPVHGLIMDPVTGKLDVVIHDETKIKLS